MGAELKTVRVFVPAPRRYGGPNRGSYMRLYPEQSTRQEERGRRYQNYANSLTGHLTSGLKKGAERGLVPK